MGMDGDSGGRSGLTRVLHPADRITRVNQNPRLFAGDQNVEERAAHGDVGGRGVDAVWDGYSLVRHIFTHRPDGRVSCDLRSGLIIFYCWPKRERYSAEAMKALTSSA